ncbi:MAG: hypothetical protein ACIAS6_01825 [Phycisphaerales bacterium JB060]
MRASVWTLAIVVAGLGLAVALAGWMGGGGHPERGPVAGQEAEGARHADADAAPVGADVELVIHRVVPRTHTFELGGQWIVATREEAAMLEGGHVGGQELKGSLVGPRVWFTLINRTDSGYLISDRTLRVMLEGRVDITDGKGQHYGLHPTGLISWANEEVFSVPLAAGGRREMVMGVGLTRLQRQDEPTPLEEPDAEANALLEVESLSYGITQRCELLARPIAGGVLGEPVRLRVLGSGTCEVSFDGPM